MSRGGRAIRERLVAPQGVIPILQCGGLDALAWYSETAPPRRRGHCRRLGVDRLDPLIAEDVVQLRPYDTLVAVEARVPEWNAVEEPRRGLATFGRVIAKHVAIMPVSVPMSEGVNEDEQRAVKRSLYEDQ